MKNLFWFLWSGEFLFMCWWLWDDMKLKYMPLNPYISLGFIWLFVAIVSRLAIESKILSNVLVIIPAVPLGIMALFMIIILLVQLFGGTIRWN